MNRLLIATGNAGKIREYQVLLRDVGVELTWPARENLHVVAEEVGATYAENARLKAEAYAQASGLWALADDSGLEVEALEGAPGVRSARYAGEGALDQDRYQLLLERLAGTPNGSRGARFRCVIALASPRGHVWFREGCCEGMIATSPSGGGGFGYDPVFYIPELGCTMAELPAAEKNCISHRARAAQQIVSLLGELRKSWALADA